MAYLKEQMSGQGTLLEAESGHMPGTEEKHANRPFGCSPSQEGISLRGKETVELAEEKASAKEQEKEGVYGNKQD